MSQWYYAKDGNQHGPYDADDMRLAVKTGELSGGDLVWREGLADWKPIKEVPELASAMPAAQPAAAAPVAATPVAQPTYQQQPLQYQQAYSTSGQIMFTPTAMEMLRQTKPWVRFMGVLLFVITGLIVAGALVMLFVGVVGAASSPRGGAAVMGASVGVALVYLLMGALYFFPALFLNRYASHINTLLSTRREDALEAALAAQKTFWRYVGIVVLVVLGLYVLILVAAIVLGGIGAMM